jgi:hypothetical protein
MLASLIKRASQSFQSDARKRQRDRSPTNENAGGLEPLEARTFLSASVHGSADHTPPPHHPQPNLYAPHSTVRGQTLGQWSAAWWQWAFSHNVDQSPFFDETGARAGLGDVGKVFFLTGVVNTSGTAERTITLPSGKPVFFPILNNECSTVEGNGTTAAELDACQNALLPQDTTQPLHTTIDGVSLSNADIHSRYEISPPFEFTLPSQGVNVLEYFGVPGALPGVTSLSVAHGFWVMMKPLSLGHHDINFGGGDPNVFALDITYHITVVPQGQYEHGKPSQSDGPADSPQDHTCTGSNPFNHRSRIADNVLESLAGSVL